MFKRPTLDLRIHEVAKSDLLIVKKGDPTRIVVGADFPIGK
jgi:hypothetical protein